MGKSGGGIVTLLKQSLDLSEVGRVCDEVRKLLAHLGLSKLVETVELLPELLLRGHSSILVEFDITEVENVEHSHCGLVAFVSLEMGE